MSNANSRVPGSDTSNPENVKGSLRNEQPVLYLRLPRFRFSATAAEGAPPLQEVLARLKDLEVISVKSMPWFRKLVLRHWLERKFEWKDPKTLETLTPKELQMLKGLAKSVARKAKEDESSGEEPDKKFACPLGDETLGVWKERARKESDKSLEQRMSLWVNADRKALVAALYEYYPDKHDRRILWHHRRDTLLEVLRYVERENIAAEKRHVPRLDVEKDLYQRLRSKADGGKGTMLVAGYRGVGKSALVHRVVARLRRDALLNGERVIEVRLNLAQDDINEDRMLRLMASELYRALLQHDREPSSHYFKRYFFRPLLFGLCTLALMVAMVQTRHWDLLWSALTGNEWSVLRTAGGLLAVFLVPLLVAITVMRHEFTRPNWPGEEALLIPVRRRLQRLLLRMHAHVSTESGADVEIPGMPGRVGQKEKVEQKMAEPKEVEMELMAILDQIDRMDQRTRVVFVVDELDKLLVMGDTAMAERDAEDPAHEDGASVGGQGSHGYMNKAVRERKAAIWALFANLKHFLGTAKAKFVFIGGRELYDATLADVSNRDPFLGSIFSHVVYVSSFLGQAFDSDEGSESGLTVATEQYVARTLIRDLDEFPTRQPSNRDVLKYWDGLIAGHAHDPHISSDIHYAYSAMTELNHYLAFRCNGNPKRLTQIFERLVTRVSPKELSLRKARAEAHLIILPPLDRSPSDEPQYYLRISPHTRYASGLFTSLYRPFLTVYARYYGRLPDKQRVALTYLLEHVLKFHSTSFSFANLELAPETIAVNKVPEMRKFTNDILTRITGVHLRRIDNGLFDYQFRARTYSELGFLSKIREEDAAALNFTLDESLPVKRHFYRRLHELQRELQHLQPQEQSWEVMQHRQSFRVLNRIPELHRCLGDLHFLDSEFDEAIDHFRAVAAWYAPRLEKKTPWEGIQLQSEYALERFHEYVRATLRQIHCLEKINAADDALVLSGSLSRSVREYLANHIGQNHAERSNWKLMLLALMMKPAIAEKQSRFGLKETDFDDVTACTKLLNDKRDTLPVKWLRANMYLNIGLILCYRGRGPEILLEATAETEGVGDKRPTKEHGFDCNHRSRLPSSGLESYIVALVSLLELEGKRCTIATVLHACIERIESLPNGAWDMQRIALFQNLLGKIGDSLAEECAKGLSPELVGGSYPALLFSGSQYFFLPWHPSHGPCFAFYLLKARVDADNGGSPQAIQAITKILQVLVGIKESLPRNRYIAQEIWWREVEGLWRWARARVAEVAQYAHAPIWHGRDLAIEGLKTEWLKKDLKDSNPEALAPQRSGLIELDSLWFTLSMNNDLTEGQDTAEYHPMLATFHETIKRATANQYARVQMLRYVLLWNEQQYSKAKDVSVQRQLIVDSITSVVDMITVAERMGISYTYGHVMLAEAYYALGTWCSRLQNTEEKDELRKMAVTLGLRVGRRFRTRLYPELHYAMALEHYEQAIHAHSRGPAYRRIMEDQYFVEDDYNDNIQHFSCTYERMRISLRRDYVRQRSRLRILLERMERFRGPEQRRLIDRS